MNKVKAIWKYSLQDLEQEINELADDYEIINILPITNTGTDGYKVLVLYKCE